MQYIVKNSNIVEPSEAEIAILELLNYHSMCIIDLSLLTGLSESTLSYTLMKLKEIGRISECGNKKKSSLRNYYLSHKTPDEEVYHFNSSYQSRQLKILNRKNNIMLKNQLVYVCSLKCHSKHIIQVLFNIDSTQLSNIINSIDSNEDLTLATNIINESNISWNYAVYHVERVRLFRSLYNHGYTVGDISMILNLTYDSTIKLFEDESGIEFISSITFRNKVFDYIELSGDSVTEMDILENFKAMNSYDNIIFTLNYMYIKGLLKRTEYDSTKEYVYSI